MSRVDNVVAICDLIVLKAVAPCSLLRPAFFSGEEGGVTDVRCYRFLSNVLAVSCKEWPDYCPVQQTEDVQ